MKTNDRYETNPVDMTVAEYKFGLSKEQQQIVIDRYNNGGIRNLSSLAREIHPELDGKKSILNDPLYKGLQAYIVKITRYQPCTHFDKKQLDFIHSNHDSMKCHEIAATLFPDRKVTTVSKETKDIRVYCEAKDLKLVETPKKRGYTESYVVNIINSVDQKADYKLTKLTKEQKNNVQTTISYLNSPRYKIAYDGYNEFESELFEAEFVKAVYSKPDLTSEDVNVAINLCREYVIEEQIIRQKGDIDALLERQVDEDDGNSIRKNLVDQSTSLITALDKCRTRQDKYINSLGASRANRIKNEKDFHRSMAAFVVNWRQEEKRKQWLVAAKARNLMLKEKADELKDFNALIASIDGVSDEELGLDQV